MERFKLRLKRVIIYTFLIFILILCVVPFYLMIINGTRASTDIIAGVSLIPGNNIFPNYESLSQNIHMFKGLLNSSIVAFTTTLLCAYVCALAAYAFAFFHFPFKKVFYGLILLSMMVPPHLGLIGYFELLSKIKLLDTLMGIILPGVASAFAVFFYVQYLKSSLHESLLESARIDGASEFRIFHSIALPIMIPGIAVMSIFTFVFNWNNYIFPLVVLFSDDKFTVPVMIAQLNSTAHRTDFGAVYLGVAISVVPILIVFSAFSKFIISGISLGGVKE
ncbi:MAG: carbohydrate ABC transporter permease [Spirochaetes bacterium]|nr:carbohydrate ABC transporter permease [Spirochaetota bacterium]